MSRDVTNEVATQIGRYVSGDATADDLWRWLAQNVLWTDEERENADVSALTTPAAHYIYEYQAGHRTDQGLRTALADLLSSHHVGAAVLALQGQTGDPQR